MRNAIADHHAPKPDVERVADVAIRPVRHHSAGHHVAAVHGAGAKIRRPPHAKQRGFSGNQLRQQSTAGASRSQTTRARCGSTSSASHSSSEMRWPICHCFDPRSPESENDDGCVDRHPQSKLNCTCSHSHPSRRSVSSARCRACRRATPSAAQSAGSVFIAERAGIRIAISATSASITVTAAKLTGSCGLTPKSTL